MQCEVSIIIPTYNRFSSLLDSIRSVLNQTHENFEIIVINDGSKQEEYYNFDFHKLSKKIKIIHLETNSKNIFGYACAGYVRNMGIKEAKGNYLAFLDDDDIWFPRKLENQLKMMKLHNCEMSCTEGYWGDERFNPKNNYKKYLHEKTFEGLKQKYKRFGVDISNGFANIWNIHFIDIHNSVVTSSVLVSKTLMEKVGGFKNINRAEDYDCWKRIMKHTDCFFLQDEPYFYFASFPDHGSNYVYN